METFPKTSETGENEEHKNRETAAAAVAAVEAATAAKRHGADTETEGWKHISSQRERKRRANS